MENVKGTETSPVWMAIPGYFDFADVYREFASRADTGSELVEVGSLLGRSACYLGSLLKEAGGKATLFCVDTWPDPYVNEGGRRFRYTYETCCSNVRMAGLIDIVIPIRLTSLQAATQFRSGQLAAVFIDASHTYESVLSDIEAWLPKVKIGGLIAGHDYSGKYPGVIKAADQIFGSNLRFAGQCWIHDIK